MARETKVGLLAGLAFIICFAVILANRGRQEAITSAIPHLVDRPSSNSRPLPAAPSAGANPSQTIVDAADPRRGPAQAGRPAAAFGAQRFSGPPASGADAAMPRSTVPAQGTAVPAGSPFTPVGGNQWTAAPVNPSAAPSIGATGDTVLSSSLADATVRRNASVPQMDSPTTGAGSPLPSERVPPDVRSAASPTITAEPSNAAFVRYTVMPGDTLTKIASVYYGTKSNSVVSAIADANRAVVPTRNSLRAGVELTLPVVEVTGTAAVDAAQVRDDPPQTRIATAGSDIGDGWARWYQVKKGDRYAGIARDELGDAGRWKEIYELNKEKFPDPGQIREGVRIKLPATTGAGGQGQRKPSKEKRG